jgi:uncharacterized membrane protein YfcA
MITDPWFYLAALPVVFLVGLSKGGFLPGVGVLGVPLLSLAVLPTTAAGIMLPVLMAMDAVAVWSFRKTFDRHHLMAFLPGALVGTGIGWATAAWVTDADIKIIVGVIGLTYMAYNLFLKAWAISHVPPGRKMGAVLGTIAGFTSFISHAGGPPMQIYLQPQKLPPAIFAGTSIMCFAIINLIKFVPFLSLGLINSNSLVVDVALLPMAIVAALCGVWLAKRVPQEPFYVVANICLAVVSVELIREGVTALLRG